MENLLLKTYSNLVECEKVLGKRLSFLIWQGIELVSKERRVYGWMAEVIFQGKVYYVMAALEGFESSVYPKDKSYLVEAAEIKSYENIGLKTETTPEVFPEYYLVLEKFGSLTNRWGQNTQEVLDQGLGLLRELQVPEDIYRAYALCFFVKREDRLGLLLSLDLRAYDAHSVVLAMEFRRLYLAYTPQDLKKTPLLSSIKGINEILAVDKILAYRAYRKKGDHTPEETTHYHSWLKLLAPYFNYKIKVKE